MKQKKPETIEQKVRQAFLPFVRQPSRYIGGEMNQVRKDLGRCDVTCALCFPDIYEIGMSHTGLAIIYHVLNSLENVAAERAFAPWTDAEEIMRKNDIPLFSLESKVPLGDFDVVGFSLTNELCYTNMLNMLDLADIPIRSVDRGEEDPIIIAGGQSSNCAEPIAPFVDIFILGQAEYAAGELVSFMAQSKKENVSRKDFLAAVAGKFDFAYIPALYEFEYENDKIKSFIPASPDLPTTFHNATVDDLDSAPVPERPIVPFTQAVHERISIEIMRGCPGRCRFCQASFCRRPIRYRSPDRILEIAKQNYEATAFDTISLLSLSTADYPYLEELVEKLNAYFAPKHVGISLPSLKVQAQLKLLPKLVTSVRKSGLTIAVEAASEKLRKIINKPITDDDLLAAIEEAYRAGYQSIKLYFMVGLPGETEEEIKRIVDLAYEIAILRRKVDNKTANINLAVSWLVPKPHTPFAWLGQKPRRYFHDAMQILLERKRDLNARFINIKFHNIETSVLESAMAKADRRTADVIETAWKNGAKFDLWTECFDFEIWKNAFASHGMDLDSEAQKVFDQNDILPWDHLTGPKKDSLLTHLNDSLKIIE